MDNENTITVLNNLIEICKDSQKSFEIAAENVDNDKYKKLFEKVSKQRDQFITELCTEVLTLGGDPEESGSISSSLHRGWMNLKSTVTDNNEIFIISESEAGEDLTVKNYREALGKNLPKEVEKLVQRQYLEVKISRGKIRSLKNRIS